MFTRIDARDRSCRALRGSAALWAALAACAALAFAGPSAAQEPAAPQGAPPAAPESAPAAPEAAPAPAAPAESEEPAAIPFFQRDPFDRIALKDGSVIEVLPLDLSGRRVPENPRGADKLNVRFADRLGEQFELQWRDIEQITLWEQLVLAEAEALVAAGDFDGAFDFYDYLSRNHGGFPGVKESIERYLYEEAKVWQRQAKYDHSLALLLELHARNPQAPGLANALGVTTSRLIQAQLDQGEYPAARRLLAGLSKKYPDEASVLRWSGFLSAEAQKEVEQASAHLGAGRVRAAQAAARRAMTIWPDLPAARALYQDLNEQYPYVAVGVMSPVSRAPAERSALDDWAFRRSNRLLHRPLMELSGYGVEGGEYRSPLGEMESVDLGLGLNFRLRRDVTWSPSGEALTGYDVARHLLMLADPESPTYRPDWGEILAGVDVGAVFDVHVRLKRTHMRPEAMLQGPLVPWDVVAAGAQPVATDGPYRAESYTDDTVEYLLNENYFARGSTQPHLIDERHYSDSASALKALRLGEISVLDRVNPWEVAKAADTPGISVAEYGVPTVHCLIPNRASPLASNRQFRRALVYGINRPLILGRDLLGRRQDPGSRLISGPFPAGYAYDDRVEVRPFDPNLARVLSRVALTVVQKDAAAAKANPEADPGSERPPSATEPAKPPTAAESDAAVAAAKIVLAHPAAEIARTACREIKRQLEAVMGISVELVEIDPHGPRDALKYDLLYAELALWDPVVDARRLLGTDGLAGATNPYLDLALRDLAMANDWRTAREKLFEIHRLAAEDVTVVPLWQLTDYFAYRQDLDGLGGSPVSLYQNIEGWRIAPLPPGLAGRASSREVQLAEGP